jgi:hypothetical protein
MIFIHTYIAGEAVGGKLFKNVLCESELFKFHIVFDILKLRHPLLLHCQAK